MSTNRATEWLQFWPAVVVPVGVIGLVVLGIQNAVLSSHVRELRTEATALHQFVAQNAKKKGAAPLAPSALGGGNRQVKAGKQRPALPGEALAAPPPDLEERMEKAKAARAAQAEGKVAKGAKGGKAKVGKGGKAGKAKAKAPPP